MRGSPESGVRRPESRSLNCLFFFLLPFDLLESGEPHLPQKAKPGGFSNPHCGQRGLSGLAHLPQKFMPSGLSKPQLGQRILSHLPVQKFPSLAVPEKGKKVNVSTLSEPLPSPP